MKITDIAPRRHRLSQLYIDGEAAVKVDTETLLRRGIAIGDELEDEELHELLQASAKHRAEETVPFGAPRSLQKRAGK